MITAEQVIVVTDAQIIDRLMADKPLWKLVEQIAQANADAAIVSVASGADAAFQAGRAYGNKELTNALKRVLLERDRILEDEAESPDEGQPTPTRGGRTRRSPQTI